MTVHVQASNLDFSAIGRKVAVSFQSGPDDAIGHTMCLRRIVDWDRAKKTITVMNCDEGSGIETVVPESFVFWWGERCFSRTERKFRDRIDGIVDDALGMGDPQ